MVAGFDFFATLVFSAATVLQLARAAERAGHLAVACHRVTHDLFQKRRMTPYFSLRRQERKGWRMRIDLHCKPGEFVGLCELCGFARPFVGSFQEKTMPRNRGITFSRCRMQSVYLAVCRHRTPKESGV